MAIFSLPCWRTNVSCPSWCTVISLRLIKFPNFLFCVVHQMFINQYWIYVCVCTISFGNFPLKTLSLCNITSNSNKMTCSIALKQQTSYTKDAFVPVYSDKCQVCIHGTSLFKLVQKQMTLLWYTKRHWPITKAILTQHKSNTDPVQSDTSLVQKRYWPGIQKQYRLIPFLVPLHNVSVPAVPEPVTSPVLVYGTGTCTGTVCKTCIERCHISTLYRIQWYRTSTAYLRWTVLEWIPIDTGMFTGMVTTHENYLIMWLFKGL